VLINERDLPGDADPERPKLGAFVHGFTYAGHPVAAARRAGDAEDLRRDRDMVDHVRAIEPTFLKLLGDMVDHPLVGQFRGCGLIGGLEIVADKDTRAIHDKALDVPGRIDRHARERGLILRFVGNRIAFSPPLIITADQVGEIATRLKGALDDTLDELSRG
jgi:4-aminobutyrate--pyruvate transaminase